MKRFAHFLVWSDLDGTLLDAQRRLPEANLSAIAQLHAQGGRFGIATGRSEHSLTLNFPGLVLTLPSVCYNGALVQWHPEGEVVRQRFLSEDPVPMMRQLMDACPGVGVEVLAGGTAFLVRRSTELDAQLAREGLPGRDCGFDDIPAGWYKILLGGTPEDLAHARRLLLPLAADRFHLVYSESTLLEVLEPGVTKGDAIRSFLSDSTHWRHEAGMRVVAIGDNDNDADMLAMADIGIAVANASPAARAAADHILPDAGAPCMPQVLRLLERIG